MITNIKNEFKEIKWLNGKDVIKQSLYSIGVIIIVSTILLVYELGIQTLLGLIF